MLRTFFFYLTFFPCTIVAILIGFVICLFGGADRLHLFGRRWGRLCLWLAGIRLVVTGSEHLPQGRPVIYLANHQGNFDIPVLFAGIPGQFRWLAKIELFRIPLFGHVMHAAGYIPVERNDRRKAIASMNEAARRVAAGTSIMIFPEGTRSPDGVLLPFKKGGFMLALQSQADIVPVAIAGSAAIMPKGSIWMRSGTIRLRIFPPIPMTKLSVADRDRLIDTVRDMIAAEVAAAPESR